MNRIAIASVIAAAACAAAGVQAETFVDNARVRSVEPQYENVSVPREQCSTQWVNETHRVGGAPSQGPNVAGAVIGGVAGGIIGNQVGKGSGKDVATGLGAVIGAFAGDRVASANNRPEQYEVVPRQVTQCQTVQEVQTRITGYRVAYDWRGQTYHTITREQPGPNLQVRVSVDPVVR